MPMKGRYPIRRTLEYLQKGDIVFKNTVKIMTVNYNTHGELSDGARKFVFFNIPQIQYKNPWVQVMMFKNLTPSPFLKFYLDDGDQVLVDAEGKDHKDISQHVKKILGKSEEVLRAEELARMVHSNPANFGPKKYCLREYKLTSATKEAVSFLGSPSLSPSSSVQGSRRGSISSMSSISSVLDEKDDERIRCCRHCMGTLHKREQQMDEKDYAPEIVKFYEVGSAWSWLPS
ncbi:UNVERIFIED_CONTAM: hypothetical protein FKN15_016469 [Acipenser sinensis]